MNADEEELSLWRTCFRLLPRDRVIWQDSIAKRLDQLLAPPAGNRRAPPRCWIAKKPRWPRLGSWSAQNHLKSVEERYPDDPAYVIQGS